MREAADRPLKVGIVGCGSVALGFHIPAFLEMPDLFRVVAVADPTPSLRTKAQALLGLSAADAYASFEPLVERDDVEVVDVCTPPSVRRQIVTAAAVAGKHIFSEKPLATVPIDADEMARAAESAGVMLALAHNYLFLPEFVAARSIIEEGEIGAVEVAILNYLGVPENPGSAHYKPGWRHESGMAGGGVLMDMLHVIYVAELLLGQPIRRVSAYVDARKPGSGVEDLALCRFETESNVALVNVGWGVGPGGVEVSGTTGRLVIRYQQEGTSPFFPVERILVSGMSGQRLHSLPEPVSTEHSLLFADFADSVRNGRQPIGPGDQGKRALEAVIAVYKSAALDRCISLPLEPDDPVYQLGLAGLAQLDVAPTSRLRLRGLLGIV